MPQLNGADGDDLGANDELIAFKDEGEREEKRNVSAEGDLDDVKSSLVNESETNSSSDSEVSLTGHQTRRRRLTFPPAPSPSRLDGLVCQTSTPMVLNFLCVYVRVQADRRSKPNPDLGSRARHNQLFGEEGNAHKSALLSLYFCRNCETVISFTVFSSPALWTQLFL